MIYQFLMGIGSSIDIGHDALPLILDLDQVLTGCLRLGSDDRVVLYTGGIFIGLQYVRYIQPVDRVG